MAAAPPDIKRLGRYDIERVLGKGAMGVVYGGIDPRLNRKVAIKTILKSALDEDTAKEYSMRFVREAQAVARLNHANIVQVYDFGEEGDIAYIVMEFIQGKELKDFFDANERFDIKEAVHIMGELCEALHFAHEHGIVHRDIKPANVMIDSQGRVKLADFGVARIQDADRNANEKTQAGTVVGTPAYMSPEQISGGEIDRRTDIFSAGIILYQFLTGEKPFTGSGAWTIAKKIIQDDPPLPSSINNSISPLFDTVVNKALSKQVETRFQTARDLGEALKAALQGKGMDDESDRTVVGSLDIDLGEPSPQIAAASPTASGVRAAPQQSSQQEVELEFWRSIKDGNDPDDFDLYVEQFPTGIYAALAKRKSAKLRGVSPADETGLKAKQQAEQEKREIEEAARREAEAKSQLAEEKAKLEAEMKQRQEEYEKRQAELEAKRAAEEKKRAEEDAKAKAEFEARLAAREAEFQKKQAEAAARAEAEAKKRAETAAKAEADFKKRQAEAAAKAEAEAKARAEALAKEKAKQDALIAKKEAELREREMHAPKKVNPLIPIGIAVLVAGIGIGLYSYFRPAVDDAALKQQLALLEKANAQLAAAQQKQQEMVAALEKAKQAEEEARKAGDLEKLKQLEAARKAREAELAKQQELIAQREKAAAEQARKAKEEADRLKRSDAEKAAAAKVAAAKAAAEKAAAERAAAEKAAAAQAAADRAAAEKAAAAKIAAQKAAAEKTAAEKVAAAVEKAAVEDKGLSDRQREAREARRLRELAEQAAAKRAEAARQRTAAARTREQTASAKTSSSQSSSSTSAAESSSSESASGGGAEKTQVAAVADPTAALMKQASALESSGKVRSAVRIYRRAAAQGNGQAAKILGDIYSNGRGDQPRDYAESLRWYTIAEKMGVKIDHAGGRSTGG